MKEKTFTWEGRVFHIQIPDEFDTPSSVYELVPDIIYPSAPDVNSNWIPVPEEQGGGMVNFTKKNVDIIKGMDNEFKRRLFMALLDEHKNNPSE